MSRLWKIGALVSAVGIIVGCSQEVDDQDDGTSDADGATGGDLIFAMSSDAVDLSPHGSNDTASTQVRSQIYENLTIMDENMDVQPHLAQSFEQIDEHTWSFELREDIIFHDGEPMTAEAVKLSLERVIDPDVASPRAFLFDMIESIDVESEYEVTITTSYPFAPLPAHLAHNGGSIISPKALEAAENDEFNLDTETAGTGPFTLTHWYQGNEAVLTRNPDYWGDDVSIETVTFKVVPEELTRIGMVANGEAHVADTISPLNTNQVESTENVELVSGPSLGMTYLGFNNQHETFADEDVRRAISMAIDKEVLLEGILQGNGKLATAPISDLIFGYDEGLEGIDYDPEAAEALLQEIGETDLQFTLWVGDADEVTQQMAVIIQDQLSEIGVQVDIESLEWGTLLDGTANGSHEAMIMSWTAVSGDSDNGLYNPFHSDNWGGSGNRTYYENAEVDELLFDARQETDVNTREQMYHDAQAIIVEEAPMVYLAHQDNIYAQAENVEGLIKMPDNLYRLFVTTITDDESY
ncbi:glutathione ABC transporter substrate-binding protein [Geomicrobium sp. JCM 19038]|uniref:glutathione ABC transporter substrate-binding protein n=1 Tax=Geomicrobium sp. JCM 19038 TaxID=1460635 RepID=UPI00045F4531|nr:glutathione ABC transporter substrate-binding protein [Geomicrobium sp. JCM 19038]GAK09872.1 oligopeptide ABC transporter, periplasmic oligopeptide-binding protein OppA [Geomicrobium sp. JCM 19038]